MTLADISNGNVDGADWLFLIAAIVFGLAAIVAIASALRSAAAVPPGNATGNPHVTAAATAWHTALVDAGLCVVAIAWLLL